MKRLRLDRWATQLQPPRNPRLPLQRCPFSSCETRAPRGELLGRQYQIQRHSQDSRRHISSKRRASTAATVEGGSDRSELPLAPPGTIVQDDRATNVQPGPFYSPSHRQALRSAKLAALHARLSLPSKLPILTLARCLIDASADPRAGHNNKPLSILGQDLLGYYTSEHLLCQYPRLPMPIVFAAQYAYNGDATLAAIRSEWGVETVASPGTEVDPGLLQLKRMVPGNSMLVGEMVQVKNMPKEGRIGGNRRNSEWSYRRSMSSRIVYDDQFGDEQMGLPPADAKPYPGALSSASAESEGSAGDAPEDSGIELETLEDTDPTTVEAASASFVRALTGALYLHCGAAVAKRFHRDHVLSRQVPLHQLFHFTHPTRDLSKLCGREAFEPPVARLISETGRLSRTPVFVVGVYSGDDKLGEAAGASLNEARVRAAAAALRSWYLYSPPDSDVVLPSEVEGIDSGNSKDRGGRKTWKPQMIDVGEVIT